MKLHSINLNTVAPTTPVNKLKRVLFYYGEPICYNDIYDINAIVANISASYDTVVLGDGYLDPTHQSYGTTIDIINAMKTAGMEIFLYVPFGNRDVTTINTKADMCLVPSIINSVDGIFLDEFGFDYGSTRENHNLVLAHIRAIKPTIKFCYNAWNPVDVFCSTLTEVQSKITDQFYINSFQTGNPNNVALNYDASKDCYLNECFAFSEVETDTLDTNGDHYKKVQVTNELNQSVNMDIWGLAILPFDNGDIMFNLTPSFSNKNDLIVYTSALALVSKLDGLGVTEIDIGSDGYPIPFDLANLQGFYNLDSVSDLTTNEISAMGNISGTPKKYRFKTTGQTIQLFMDIILGLTSDNKKFVKVTSPEDTRILNLVMM